MNAAQQNLVKQLAKTLNKGSKFYAEDYAALVRGVTRKTAKGLRESLGRSHAIATVSSLEVAFHCVC